MQRLFLSDSLRLTTILGLGLASWGCSCIKFYSCPVVSNKTIERITIKYGTQFPLRAEVVTNKDLQNSAQSRSRHLKMKNTFFMFWSCFTKTTTEKNLQKICFPFFGCLSILRKLLPLQALFDDQIKNN